jgi:curli biogenesis system outer membrane secretion channel CsgG
MYKLPPPTQLLRMMIQQSKCFQVVERGMAMKNIMQERALAGGGQLQQGQNIGGGQMVAADFLLTPTVQFSESNAGGAGLGAIGGLFGPIGSIVGAVAGGLKNKQAQTSIIISDARSGLQLAAAEGNVEKADFALGGVLGGVGAGAYSNTAEGKIVAAALLDNYNNVVKSIRDLPQLADSKINDMSKQNASSSPEANAFVNGEVLRPKIAGIQILATPSKGQKVIERVAKDGEMLYLGDEKNGFLKVQSSSGEGWVDKNLVKR